MDSLTPEQRGELMSRVKSKNTRPEMLVRRTAHAMGYRYSLHRRDLPGCPDLVFPKRRKAIFVHGCFWHRQPGCAHARMPKSRLDFWEPKLNGNQARDKRNLEALAAMGWRVLVIWECETRDIDALKAKLSGFLESPG